MCFKAKLSNGTKIDRRKIAGLPSDEKHLIAINLVIEECGRTIDIEKVKTILSGVVIEWWNDVYPSPSSGVLNTVVVDKDNLYSGLTIGDTCKVAWRGKINRTALVHELLHIIGRDIISDDNASHSNEVLNKLEATINYRLQILDI